MVALTFCVCSYCFSKTIAISLHHNEIKVLGSYSGPTPSFLNEVRLAQRLYLIFNCVWLQIHSNYSDLITKPDNMFRIMESSGFFTTLAV